MAHVMQHQTESIIQGRSLHLATCQTGSDLTLFFVHGGGGNKNQWRQQFSYFLKKNVNIVAWDAFGHGSSQNSRKEQDFSAEAFLTDFTTLFERHKTEKNIIIAHSFGCRLTLAWLLQVWQKQQRLPINGAVLLGPAPHEHARRGLFNNWMDKLPLPVMELFRPTLARRFESLAWHPATDEKLRAQERLATRGNTLFMMRALLRHGPVFKAEFLQKLPPFPVTLIAGQQDWLVPFATIQTLKTVLTGATLHVLDHCAHQIMLEQPQQVNHLIDTLIHHVETGQS